MSRIDFNKDAASIAVTDKISRATGINNFSPSSKVRLISDILVDEISNTAETINQSLDALYLETAIGNDLDVKAAQYGIYRKIRDSIFIDKDDSIILIEPKVFGQTFGDSIRETALIRRGETLSLGSSFEVSISEDVTISPGLSNVPISGTVQSTSEGGFTINTNDVYKLDTLSTSLGIGTNTLQVRFLKPISIDGGRESDELLRARAILSRNGRSIGTIDSIEAAINQVPDVSGYIVLQNIRGSGSVDIGFVTQELQDSLLDDGLSQMRTMLFAELSDVMPIGKSLNIFTPAPALLNIAFTSDLGEEMDKNIKDVMVAAFIDNYVYSDSNIIAASDIELSVNTIIPDANVKITNMALYDESIDATIFISSSIVVAPSSYFIYLENDLIARTVDV